MSSGDTLVVLTAAQGEPPSTNYATFDTRNNALVLEFDDGTDESIEFGAVMPRHYDGGGVTVTLHWMSEDQTTGNCIWNVAFKSLSDDADDLDTKAFAASQNVTATTASAAGELDYAETTHTDGAQMDSVAAGEYFRLQVLRDADNASDTLTNDAQLLSVEIRET